VRAIKRSAARDENVGAPFRIERKEQKRHRPSEVGHAMGVSCTRARALMVHAAMIGVAALTRPPKWTA
jgi:hypothetical protein